jgi:flagellar basal-body rod modification protein FlgD
MSIVDPAASGLTPTGSGSPTTTGLNQLDNSQTFLNLLVAQLKNQNPDNPSDPTAFMTEIAQLTAVQSQTNLAAEEQTVAADSMLGQIVSGTNSQGQSVIGVVSSILLPPSGGPELELAGQNGTLSLAQINQVYSASAVNSPSSTNSSNSTKA